MRRDGDVNLIVFTLVGVAIALAGVACGLVIAYATGVGVKTVTTETLTPAQAAAPRCNVAADGQLPDKHCTPGLLNRHVRQSNIRRTICRKGYSTSIRPSRTVSTRLKRRIMAAYGVTGPRNFQLDHLISLELGGDPLSPKNLWPEPKYVSDGALTKDQVENKLHRLVCAKPPLMTLMQAQHVIRTDWRAALGG